MKHPLLFLFWICAHHASAQVHQPLQGPQIPQFPTFEPIQIVPTINQPYRQGGIKPTIPNPYGSVPGQPATIEPYIPGVSQPRQKTPQEELAEALVDMGIKPYAPEPYYSSEAFARESRVYSAAFDTLKAMLEGTRPMRLGYAVFTVENAYYGNALSYRAFTRSIDSLVAICRSLMLYRSKDVRNGGDCN